MAFGAFLRQGEIANLRISDVVLVSHVLDPNGSCENIAGILNAQKNVLGLMPHPENATDCNLGGTDGKPLFQSLVDAIT